MHKETTTKDHMIPIQSSLGLQEQGFRVRRLVLISRIRGSSVAAGGRVTLGIRILQKLRSTGQTHGTPGRSRSEDVWSETSNTFVPVEPLETGETCRRIREPPDR